MNGKRFAQLYLVLLVITTGIALQGDVSKKSTPAKATTKALGGPDRFLTFISTDKPIYRPGETVYVRGVTLHAESREPLSSPGSQPVSVEIKGPKGDTVTSGYAQAQESVASFAWQIPQAQAGGKYKVRLSHPWLGHAPAEREFDIRAFRSPRLKTQILFARDGYGPGDEVTASLHAERAEGGFPAGAKVTVLARLDGVEIHRGQATIDGQGNCEARFALPESIERGEGTLALVIEDGGIVETASKTLPILLQTIDIRFYPEGGDLVSGLPARVYFDARTPAKKPADLAGFIVDQANRRIADVRSEHEGRGRFEFTPRKGEAYALKITEPAGIARTFPLPEVTPAGGIIRATTELYANDEPVVLQVASTSAGPWTVTLSKREREVARSTLRDGTPGSVASVHLTPPASADGVLIATLWDENDTPLAERLIFRAPATSLRVSVKADRPSYVPGDTVTLTVTTTDDRGRPATAVVGLTVTDDSVLELIETREQAPRLPVMVLLESDVKELADAHVYLDRENPEAPRAVDLLLGTQGWRRFAFLDTVAFVEAHGDAARRVLALTALTQREVNRLKMSRMALADGGGGGDIVLEAAPAAPAQAQPVGADRPPEREPVAPDGEIRDELRDALEKAKKKEMAQGLLENDAEVRHQNFQVVRVYAHQLRPGRQPGDRVDFTDTVYWNAGVKTDEKTGKATVSFALSDSVTSFRVLADAFDSRGALGAGDALVESAEPFYVEPKLPLEVTTGDVIELPVSMVNGTADELDGASLQIIAGRGVRLPEGDRKQLRLGPKGRGRVLLPLEIGQAIGEREIVLRAAAGAYSDRVTRSLKVAPLGFPVEVGHGGLLVPGGTFSCVVDIPADVVAGSVASEIKIYPTPLANLTEALERLLREPHGCFEQTSSTTYPLVMAQQYFVTHSGVDPKLIERSGQLLDKGYKRLIGFECKSQGYEWFGVDPGHEALSAYGLLEFTDMAKVRQVDPEMLARTRQWLLNTRDGKGNFKRERRALHTWIADPECSNGYILWALLESGESPETLAREISAFKAAALESKNSYVMALGALVASKTGDSSTATKLMEKLAASQTPEGHVDGATMSIVGSSGQALRIETTALAILAWLGDGPRFAGNIEKAMQGLVESCKSGRFGSTQSTVLALRAIIEYDKTRSRVKKPGSVRVHVDGHPMGEAVAFDENSKSAIALPDISEILDAGRHEIEIKMSDGTEMPFSLAVTYHRTVPESAEECKVRLEVAMATDRVAEGELTEANVTVVNTTDETIPTPVAIVGMPGGLEVRHDQLKELVEAGRIAAYEVIGREVVLYWRSLAPGQKVELPISLTATVPGRYTAPASRAYLYYTDEYKYWVAPATVEILSKPSARG